MMIRDKVTINGLQLAVTRIGDGRPFLFCHGLCGDAMQPAEVFPHDRGWHCLALELDKKFDFPLIHGIIFTAC